MAKLILKFEQAVLKEVMVGAKPITIGRAPDNDVHIDNLAVSSHHAKIYLEEGKLVVEDLNSLNGTFVNNQRVQRATLKQGDTVLVGKHNLVVQEVGELPAAAAAPGPERRAAPKVEETVMMDARKRKELLQQAMGAGAAPGAAPREQTQTVPPARVRVPTLIVLDGKTDQKEYLLSSKLTVIGKSEMATIKLRGWFAPKVAAQINKRDDGYYIGTAGKVPKVNGRAITGPTKLSEGDVIEVAGVKLNFVYRD